MDPNCPSGCHVLEIENSGVAVLIASKFLTNHVAPIFGEARANWIRFQRAPQSFSADAAVWIVSATMGEKMDRGTDAFKSHVAEVSEMSIRQTRRGWCQEVMGCEARTEFRYFIGENQIAQSLEESDCCLRLCCSPCHAFKMEIKELNTDAEMVSMDRPCRTYPIRVKNCSICKWLCHVSQR